VPSADGEYMRVPDQFLDCAIYLYHSVPDAEKGTSAGGSGFFVAVPAKTIPGASFIFAVTNAHVIDSGADVIRFNTKTGGMKIAETDARRWVPHPKGDDIAVYPVSPDQSEDKIAYVGLDTFMNADIAHVEQIGPGDNVFIIGRFINHEGNQRNTPSLRFGHIAQMAHEPIKRKDGFMQESFLVEAKSIGGYSGSPVFAYIDLIAPRPGSTMVGTGIKGPWLLGVDWCHLNDWKPVCDANGRPLGNTQMPPWDMQVGSNTGMMGLVPAWKLAEIFMTKDMQDNFAAIEQQALNAQGPPPVTLDSAAGS
jgi:Trypsin-like peptidase domain